MRFEEVTFENGEDRLAATLVMPESEGPHPAVAIVEGSGTGVRNDPYFLALADLFGRIGFATFVWDKPGCGDSTGNWLKQDFEDRAKEAIAAVRYLRERPDIRAEAAGLWGISQGGWISPLAASMSPDIAFVIAVSGPAVSPAEQELYRVEHELRADGFPPDDVERAVQFYTAALSMLRDGRSFDEIMSALDAEGLKNTPWMPYVAALDPQQAGHHGLRPQVRVAKSDVPLPGDLGRDRPVGACSLERRGLQAGPACGGQSGLHSQSVRGSRPRHLHFGNRQQERSGGAPRAR
jgi:dienelactone hydrolase